MWEAAYSSLEVCYSGQFTKRPEELLLSGVQKKEQVQATVKLLSLGSSASAGPGTLEVADRCCLEPLPALSGELEH